MASIEKNADGSAIVKLSEPVTVRGEELSRVTIPRLRGKHLFGCPAITSVGVVIEWANSVVEPRGAMAELSVEDAVAVGGFLFDLLVTRPKAGADSSAASAATSGGAAASS